MGKMANAQLLASSVVDCSNLRVLTLRLENFSSFVKTEQIQLETVNALVGK